MHMNMVIAFSINDISQIKSFTNSYVYGRNQGKQSIRDILRIFYYNKHFPEVLEKYIS